MYWHLPCAFVFRRARGGAEENLHKMDQFSSRKGKCPFSIHAVRCSHTWTPVVNHTQGFWRLWDFTSSSGSCLTNCQSDHVTSGLLQAVLCRVDLSHQRLSWSMFLLFVMIKQLVAFQTTDLSRLLREMCARGKLWNATVMAPNNTAQDDLIYPVNCK